MLQALRVGFGQVVQLCVDTCMALQRALQEFLRAWLPVAGEVENEVKELQLL